MITMLIVIALLLSRACIAAALTVCTKDRDESGGDSRLGTVQTRPRGLGSTTLAPMVDQVTAPGAVGPQDAPLGGPWVAPRGLQDAAGGPRDAVVSATTIEQVEEAVESLDTLIQRNLEVLAAKVREACGRGDPSPTRCSKTSVTGTGGEVGWAATSAGATSRGVIKALQEFAAGHRMPWGTRGRQDASGASVGNLTRQSAIPVERTILDSLPRPLGGPAYFGGREDAVYLCGWDDAVDGIRRGNEATGPRWGSAAYMTGWNHAVRASAGVCRV